MVEKMKIRHFSKVNEELDTQLPQRQTKHSAGYDFYSSEETTILPKEIKFVPTNTKVELGGNDEVLYVFDRSSNPMKKGLCLANGVGVIDSDYDGEIKGIFMNLTDKPVTIPKDERIMQGVFSTFFKTVDDSPVDAERGTGGFGSTSN